MIKRLFKHTVSRGVSDESREMRSACPSPHHGHWDPAGIRTSLSSIDGQLVPIRGELIPFSPQTPYRASRGDQVVQPGSSACYLT